MTLRFGAPISAHKTEGVSAVGSVSITSGPAKHSDSHPMKRSGIVSLNKHLVPLAFHNLSFCESNFSRNPVVVLMPPAVWLRVAPRPLQKRG
jgi:hypothetical protein